MQKELGQYPAILTEKAWSITYMLCNWPPDEGFVKGFKVVVSAKKKLKNAKIPCKNHLRLRELITVIPEQ